MINPFEDAIHFLLRHHAKHAIDPVSQMRAAALLAKLEDAPGDEKPAAAAAPAVAAPAAIKPISAPVPVK